MFAQSASATTYYVSVADGNDSYDGTEQTHTTGNTGPWKTAAKVYSFNPASGSTVLFKRGEVWREYLSSHRNNTAGNEITFSNYGTGELPIISGADIVTGFADQGGNVWAVTLTTQPKILVLDGTRGTLKASLGALASQGNWFWAANTLSLYSTSDPAIAYTTIEAGQRSSAISISHDYAIVDGFQAQYANSSANISVGGTTGHSIVRNCVSGMTAFVSGTETGIFSTGPNNLIENNVTNGSPIGIRAGLTYTDNIIQNNTISNAWNGQAYGAGGAGKGIYDQGTRTIIRYNSVTNSYVGIFTGEGNDSQIHHNLVYENHVNGIDIYGHTDGHPNSVYNNVVIHNPTQTAGHGIDVQSSGDEAVIKNNIVYITYTGAGSINGMCISSNSYLSIDIDYNNVHKAAGSTGNLYTMQGSSYNTLSDWQTALAATAYSGKAVHDISADPLFVNMASDFHLQSGSPDINAGTDVGLTTDIEGNPISGPAPDIGAYEYIQSTPPSVSISSPASGSTISGSSVTLSASATPVSPSTISSVQFKIDGSNLGPAVTSSPYSTTWDTTTISDGSHELTASATDDYGNTNTSDAVTVIVDNSVPALQTSLSNMGGHHRDVSNLLASNIPPTSPLSATQTKAFVFIRNLSFGSEGNDVVELQRFLVGQGYLSSDNITGNFRSATKSALQAFQKAQAIVFSGTPSTTGFGNLGALTRAKINTILKGAAPSVPAASATTTQSLQDLVTSLQKQLLGLMSLLIAQLRK